MRCGELHTATCMSDLAWTSTTSPFLSIVLSMNSRSPWRYLKLNQASDNQEVILKRCSPWRTYRSVTIAPIPAMQHPPSPLLENCSNCRLFNCSRSPLHRPVFCSKTAPEAPKPENSTLPQKQKNKSNGMSSSIRHQNRAATGSEAATQRPTTSKTSP